MSSLKLHIGDSGWRAIYSEGFTLEKLSAIVLSLAEIFPRQKSLIAYDSRFLSRELAQHVSRLLTQKAWKSTLINQFFPTPGLASLVKLKNYDWGLMITASHNPFYYNGLKILSSKGLLSDRSLNDKLGELAMHKIENEKFPNWFPLQKVDELNFQQAASMYLSQILSHIDLKAFKNSRLKVAWDSFAGTTTQLFPLMLHKMKLRSEGLVLAQEPTFAYRRLEPDQSSLQNLKKLLLHKKCSVGMASDLDGDRFAVLDEKGRFVLPNILGPLIAWYLLEFRQERGEIYQTVSSSMLTRDIANSYGVKIHEMPVGFQKMGAAMADNPQALLGLEETGGMAYAPHLCFKDGLIAHALLLEMLGSQKKNLSDLIALLYKKFGHYHYHRIDLHLQSEDEKNKYLDSACWEKELNEKILDISNLDGQKMYFASGWLLVRSSKTENLLRIYFESKSKGFIEKIKRVIVPPFGKGRLGEIS